MISENTKCSPPGRGSDRTVLLLPLFYQRGWRVVLPWLLYCGFIFYLSAQSQWIFQPPDFFSADKVYHALEYAVLGILTARVIRTFGSRIPTGRLAGWTALFGLLYGIGDEFHQWFVPGRWATGGDVLADTFGCWLGAVLYIHFGGIFPKKRHPRTGKKSPKNP